MASHVREDIDPNNYLQFDIIRDYPPHSMSLEVWRGLCRRWNTPGWLNKSMSGSRNRRSADISGKSSRHTSGSMGYAKRRARMKRKMNEEPNFKQIFLETHLTKECKQKLWDGDIDIYNLKELTFCTKRAEKVYRIYCSYRMVDLEAWVEEERNLIVSRLEEERDLLATRLDEERNAREELQKQYQEFMKNWRPPSN
ncbi:putative transposase, Ptta/En/Spm, plant [Helianthus annuus]|uniref:Transposase, Ptta/En/Spm, plant n=1 Tax=Helianthus annuus TaxID=4232 RepID=A0A9K3GT04_HELAN|nr:putative transposase, Ptta/En/Spm, plant [Helianthus annuus]KAJ0811979.1 putative transposase, Ptta/En/Spm, plant [Helianthus annuus]